MLRGFIYKEDLILIQQGHMIDDSIYMYITISMPPIFICTTEKGESNTYTSCSNKLVIEAMTFLSKKPLLFTIIILVETLQLAVLASSSSPVLPSPEGKNESMVNITQMFEEWIVENGRVYSDSSEKARRFEIFKATIQRRRRPYRYYLPPSAFLSYNETESYVC